MFLQIMGSYREKEIDSDEAVSLVFNLFKGYNNLILGFNNFLPDEFIIELVDDEPVLVHLCQ
jgi:paired amphipathic helix protein Sin3a